MRPASRSQPGAHASCRNASHGEAKLVRIRNALRRPDRRLAHGSARRQRGMPAGARRRRAVSRALRRRPRQLSITNPRCARPQSVARSSVRRKAAMAAIPVSIRPNLILTELFAISVSAKTRQDRRARTEARIVELRADLARAADDLGWDTTQREQQLAEIVKRLTDAERLASTEQFAVLNRAIELLTTNGSNPRRSKATARRRRG
jgi:hypothetical protein